MSKLTPTVIVDVQHIKSYFGHSTLISTSFTVFFFEWCSHILMSCLPCLLQIAFNTGRITSINLLLLVHGSYTLLPATISSASCCIKNSISLIGLHIRLTSGTVHLYRLTATCRSSSKSTVFGETNASRQKIFDDCSNKFSNAWRFCM